MKKIIVLISMLLSLAVIGYCTETVITITSSYSEAQEIQNLGSSNKWTAGNKLNNYVSGLMIGAKHATVTVKIGSQSTTSYTY